MNRIIHLTVLAAIAMPVASLFAEKPTTQPKSGIDGTVTQKALQDADPEMAQIRKYVESGAWKEINPKKADRATQVQALLFLNDLLGKHRQKNANRIEYLEAFLSEKDLRTDYLKNAPELEFPEITFDDACKIAIGIVQTPQGKSIFGPKVTSATPAQLNNMAKFYYNESMANWGTVVRDAHRVQKIALYLEQKEMLEAFFSWGDARAEQYEQAKSDQLAANREAALKRQEEQKIRSQAMAEKYQEQQHEIRLKRMDQSLQLQEKKLDTHARIRESYNQRYRPVYGGYYYRGNNRYNRRWW